jgi:hypothetical protein
MWANQIGTKFWEVRCYEHGIGDNGEYCAHNDPHLGRINLLCHLASGGKSKYAPCAVLFNFEPGVIGAIACKSPLGANELKTPAR